MQTPAPLYYGDGVPLLPGAVDRSLEYAEVQGVLNVETVKSRLARGYSRSAPLYDLLTGPLYAQGIRRLLPRLRLPPFPTILDVGCGTGINLVEAVHHFGPARLLCGIDLSPGMVETARSKAAALGVPAQIVVGDAEQLPYPDALFDLVICNSVLHWFDHKAVALREMHRVLRPGGQLVLICAAAPAFHEWFSLLDRVLRATVGPAAVVDPPTLPTASEVEMLLRGSGLAIAHIANPVVRQRVMRPDSFVRLMATVAPHWGTELPEEVRRIVEMRIAAVMRSGWPGGFPNTWAAVEAVALRMG